MNIGQIQIPDFAGTIMRGEQAQASRLQQMAMQRELEQGAAVDAALANGGAAALFGNDDVATQSVLSRLANGGRAGLAVAMPIMQQRQQRLTPMAPDQAAALGLRPGTVAMVDGLGRPVIIQASDVPSADRQAYDRGVAQFQAGLAAGNRPPMVLPPGATAIDPRTGRVIATAPRPPQSPFEASEGGDAQILESLAPHVAAGTATPQEMRQYAVAATRWQSSGQQMAQIPDPNNPGATLQVAIPRPLPPGFPAPPPLSMPLPAAGPSSVADPGAMSPDALLRGVQPRGPAAMPGATVPGTAAPPAIAPQQQGAAMPQAQPPAPTDPNAPRVLSQTPASPQARENARTAELGAGRVLDAINNFRQALEPFRGATGVAAFNPRSAEGQRLASAYELLKMAMRDESLLNTGVLQPGENVMIERMLRSPTSVSGLLADVNGYNTMLDEFAGFVQRGTDRVRGSARLPPVDWTQPRPGVATDPRGGNNRPDPLGLLGGNR